MLNNEIYFDELKNCSICPRKCNADRYSIKPGFCNSTADSGVVSICIHKGEEPVLSGKKGICNVFFGHCNMQCSFCQNYQISNNKTKLKSLSFDEVILQIINILSKGINIVGFVSPSHFIPQMKFIIDQLKIKGSDPVIVYNTNLYDNIEQIKLLDDYVNIYLPDFKYYFNDLAIKYSSTKDYFEVASIAIKEMYRQKGSSLITDEDGLAESGLIIRHLVLPNQIENSTKLLKFIAEEISTKVSISLMSQFSPKFDIKNEKSDLNRKISEAEYKRVVETMNRLGFSKGWIQDLDSSDNYLPDFSTQNPFE